MHAMDSLNIAPVDLNEGEQYVRAESGRASWKLVPTMSSDDLAEDIEPQQPATSDSVEPTNTQEQESERETNPTHPPETEDATEPVEGSCEQATASTMGQEEGVEQPATTEQREDLRETEDRSAEDNSKENQPTEVAESNAPAVDGEPMPTDVDKQDVSGEAAEPGGEISEEGETKDKTQEESLDEKPNGDEVQASAETSNNN